MMKARVMDNRAITDVELESLDYIVRNASGPAEGLWLNTQRRLIVEVINLRADLDKAYDGAMSLQESLRNARDEVRRLRAVLAEVGADVS